MSKMESATTAHTVRRRNYAMTGMCFAALLLNVIATASPSWYFTKTSHHMIQLVGGREEAYSWVRRCGVFTCEAGGSLRELRGTQAASIKAVCAMLVLGIAMQLIDLWFHVCLSIPAIGERMLAFPLVFRGASNLAWFHLLTALLIGISVTLVIVGYYTHHKTDETETGPTIPCLVSSMGINVILTALCAAGMHISLEKTARHVPNGPMSPKEASGSNEPISNDE
eukprot:TRINITY_DN3823_c0_g4_i1.p2 TRINITY_DN3823_c0_g4~~TRINITY_DN3823_c0_g4_i1.p2  ORF type:complete len:225 (+),score=67.09 TRINITY_DN3823_c0_g4_i1:110-784(+)